ncbi:MAG: DUF305 domain-containing protein [Anaerolineales bacterium]|nr:DUF305 domain-containing protein [Anaerolineales bacterium]
MEHKHSMGMPVSRLVWMAAAHFVLMYALMYAMVDRFENVLPNLNQVYMAAVMTAPMLILEIALMGGMYADRRALMLVLAASALVFVAAFVAIRQQWAIGDREFLRSMIPHHAGAILMCAEAPLEDAEIRALCEDIIVSQQEEIDQMRALLAEQ